MYKDEIKKELKEIAREPINEAKAVLIHCDVRPPESDYDDSFFG